MYKEGFGAGLTPSPIWAWRHKTLKAEEHIFENCLQNKRCSAGCKLTRAVPGTSACCLIKGSISFVYNNRKFSQEFV